MRQPPRISFPILAAALALAPTFLSPLPAEPPTVLRGEFWAELDAVPQSGDLWPTTREDAALRLVEEAAWVFSGMVSGFSFSYTPLDKLRNIEERFEMVEDGRVRQGDPRLVPGQARVEGQRLVATVEFLPDARDSLELDSFGKAPWRNAQGTGTADLALGWKARRLACEDAARDAVRSFLRGLEPNKPRLAKGRLVFSAPPRVFILSGRYTAHIRCRVEVTEILSYGVY